MNRKQLVELADARRLLLTGEGRRIRRASHLSQAEVAAQIGVSPATISRWESSTRRPVGKPAIAYARLLSDLRARQALAELDTFLGPLRERAQA